ncbi:hypothetical protein QBC46DRAFT_438930 [Diplogelasinospora grovesii]|uniref:GH64 domain-containing protein n=1 Tax=Diplogelasinospora grovesii TaxID=303347 RepID=A0AAN6NFL4_9PEZI|nr:hypothetical protein QBC46DRAFT_438930 [Diplogelasinospora grovesii]
MATLDECLQIQAQYSILQAPTIPSSTTSANTTNVATGASPTKSKQLSTGGVSARVASTTNNTLTIALQNNTTSTNVWAYITGLDINNNNAVFMLESDGATGYYPTSPPNIQSPLAQNCHIQLGNPGTYRTVTVPQLAGGRIWFCRDNQLTFLLNPGPALVEPSVTNPSDPNYDFYWSFAEFTFNSFQVFANITYVDFVSLPVSLALQDETGATQLVPGIPSTGLDTVCSGLVAQHNTDGAGWDQLVVKSSSSGTGANLRALSPNSGIVMNRSLFNGYYQPYVNAVWAKYASTPLNLDTQGQWGVVTGVVGSDGTFSFGSVGSFPQPSAADIFSCSTGAFAAYPQNTDEMGNITARLAAAFNRSTLLIDADQPTGEQVGTYYQNAITNHYSRIVHAANPDGHGYAFPYDDVAPSDAANVAGTVASGNPSILAVSVGGPATIPAKKNRSEIPVRQMARSGGHASQQVGGRRSSRGARVRRGLFWEPVASFQTYPIHDVHDESEGLGVNVVEQEQEVDEKRVIEMRQVEEVQQQQQPRNEKVDLEQGLFTGKMEAEILGQQQQQQVLERPIRSLLPAGLIPSGLLAKVESVMERLAENPAYSYLKPALDNIARWVVALLSLSLRTVVSRVVMLFVLVCCSFLLGFFGRINGGN